MCVKEKKKETRAMPASPLMNKRKIKSILN